MAKRFTAVDTRAKALLFSAFLAALPQTSNAADISFEENFLGPFGRSVHIHIDGEIRSGDADRIEGFVNELRYSDDLRVHVSFNSLGGSLAEGLRIGRYLSDLPVTVTTNVSQGVATPGECASACVFAYLGGHYRYLSSDSRLGVHQFYLTEDAAISTADGVAISQFLAGEIVAFLGQTRVRPDFFTLISNVTPERIRWVPEEILREHRVITDAIYDQSAEFRHAQGLFYLLLWQHSYYGENKIVAACAPGEGMVFSSYIQPADIHTFNHADFSFEITINGVGMPPAEWEPAPRDPRWAITHLTLEPYQLEALRTASSFGARHVRSGVFLGFEYAFEDRKLAELISGCQQPAAATAPRRQSGSQVHRPVLLDEPITLRDTDLPGGDFNSQGTRGVNIEQCLEMCLQNDGCIGFSWVERNGWCWPKHTANRQVQNQGVLSVIIRR